MSNHKAQIAPIIENAARLLNDAKILYDAKSYRSAASLAVLSIEETGKACLVYWKLHEFELFTNEEIIKASHLLKQKVLSAYRFYKEAKPIMDAANGKVLGKDMVDQMIAAPDGKWWPVHMAAITGSFDTVKQLGFYTDLNDDLTAFSIHATMGETDAKQQIAEAEFALTVFDEVDMAHFLMAVLYEQDVQNEPRVKLPAIRRGIMKEFEKVKARPTPS